MLFILRLLGAYSIYGRPNFAYVNKFLLRAFVLSVHSIFIPNFLNDIRYYFDITCLLFSEYQWVMPPRATTIRRQEG